MLYNEKTLTEIQKYLFISGGRHAQPIVSKGEGLLFDEVVQYHNLMIEHCNNAVTPVSRQEAIYNVTMVLFLSLELEMIAMQFAPKHIPTWNIDDDTINCMTPRGLLSYIESILYIQDASKPLDNITYLTHAAAALLYNMGSQFGYADNGKLSFDENCLRTITKHQLSMTGHSYFGMQWIMVEHYLKSMRIAPSVENAMAYLYYKDDKKDKNDVRYYGEIDSSGGYATIIMRPKAGAFKTPTKWYQIRMGNVDPYTSTKTWILFEVDLNKNTATIIPGPLTKPYKF